MKFFLLTVSLLLVLCSCGKPDSSEYKLCVASFKKLKAESLKNQTSSDPDELQALDRQFAAEIRDKCEAFVENCRDDRNAVQCLNARKLMGAVVSDENTR